MKNLKLFHKQLLLVSVLLLLELLLLATLQILLIQSEQQVAKAEEAEALRREGDLMAQELYEASTSLVTYGLTRSEAAGRRYSSLAMDIPLKLEKTERMAAVFPEEKEVLDHYSGAVRNLFGPLAKCYERLQHRDEPGQLIGISRFLQQEIPPAVHQMVQRFEEFGEKHRKVLAARREAENQAKSRLKLILPIGIVFELVLAGSLVFFLSKSITERIGLLAKNATRLAKGDVLLPRTEGGDEIAQLDAVFHDMAQALADAARKERAVVDGMPIGFMVLDKQGRIVSVNPRTCLLLGRRAEGLAGQSIQQLFSKSQAAAELPFDKICDRALGRIAEFEFERSDGTTFPGELSLNAIENSELFVCNILDISERHEIERMKQEFVSIVSHDLKTPIMSIQAALHMMANGTLGEVNQRGERVLKASQEDALRLIRLINDLLDVARIEAGRVDLEYSNVELSSILDRAVGAVLGIANEKRIEIVSEPTAIRLRADEERLVQVMVNLLSNSIKYSPPGSTVKITASSNDSFVEVRVTDQGCGIAPEAQRRIFERFELSDSSDRKEKGGTGLGLAICKLIIEAHGGSIGVESEAGKGSSFWITVPNVRSSVPESGGNMARAATEDNTQQSAG